MKEDLLKYKKQLILGPFFKLLEAVFELLIPTLMVNVIDRGVASGDQKYIIGMGLLMLGIAVLGFGSAMICQYYASVASQGFGTALRNKLFRTMLGFSHAETDQIGIPEMVNRITNDVNVLQQAVAMMIRLVIRAPFICIGSLVMAMYLNFKLSLIILAALPLLAAAVYIVIRVTVPIYKRVQQRLDRISAVVRENLSGVRVIRAFSKEQKENARFEAANDEYFAASVRVGKISALLNPVTSVIMNAAILCPLRRYEPYRGCRTSDAEGEQSGRNDLCRVPDAGGADRHPGRRDVRYGRAVAWRRCPFAQRPPDCHEPDRRRVVHAGAGAAGRREVHRQVVSFVPRSARPAGVAGRADGISVPAERTLSVRRSAETMNGPDD